MPGGALKTECFLPTTLSHGTSYFILLNKCNKVLACGRVYDLGEVSQCEVTRRGSGAGNLASSTTLLQRLSPELWNIRAKWDHFLGFSKSTREFPKTYTFGPGGPGIAAPGIPKGPIMPGSPLERAKHSLHFKQKNHRWHCIRKRIEMSADFIILETQSLLKTNLKIMWASSVNHCQSY